MKTGKRKAASIICSLAAFCMLLSLSISGCSQEETEKQADPTATAADILQQSCIKGGFIVHVNCGDGVLTLALKKNDSFLVHGLDSDMTKVAKAREYIASKGEYGKVSVDRLSDNRLPYTDNMVNLIVSEDPAGISLDEAMRVLTPNGVLMTRGESGWDKKIKPRPSEIDEWNQYLYNSGNNPVSKDTAVGPIRHYQWIGSPRWGRHHDTVASLTAMVSAQGRIFYIMDEGPRKSIQLPSENFLIARDAFNGTILWKRPIPEWQDQFYALKSGPSYLPRRLVAVGDRVYVTLGINAPLSELDAATGKVLRTFADTEETSEVLLSDNTLFLVIGRPEKKKDRFVPEHTYIWDTAERVRTEWAWSKKPGRIMALDLSSGKPDWTKEYPVSPLSLSADSGSIYFCNGSRLVSVDRNTGNEKWQSEEPIQTRRIDSAYAPRLVVSDDVLIFSIGSQQTVGFTEITGAMMAFSAADGKKLWEASQPLSGHHSPEDIFIIDGLVWTGNIGLTNELTPEDSGEFIGFDLHTGKKMAEFPCDADVYWFHQRCYPSKATEKYILPSRTGIEFVDVNQKHWDVNHYTRGGCLYGVMPSNGLIYTPPHACACYMEAKLNGLGALSGALSSEPDLKEESAKSRLDKGPAYNNAIADNSGSEDWPTYRHDNKRSGYTSSEVSSEVTPGWKRKLGGRLSSPVVAGNRLYVAQIDAHTLHTFDAATGDPLWRYTAGGRVDSPPTIYKGRVLFGSADGYVYCLNSTDGALIWRFRAAPLDRRMMAFEQLESLWPVHGNVLVQDGNVYCVAGRSMFLDSGMRLLQLDPMTGKMISETVMDEIDPDTGKNLHAYIKKLDMPVGLPDILSSDGEYLYMRSQQFDLNGKRTFIGVRDVGDQDGNGAHVFSPIGFLDDSQFSRSYMMYGKSVMSGWGGWEIMAKATPAGRLIAVDENAVYGFGRKPEFYAESIILEYQLFAAEKVGSPESIEKIKSTILKKGATVISEASFNYAGDWKLRQGLPRDEQTAVQFKWKIEKPSFQVRAMVLADKTLFVSGPPDIVDEEENFFILDNADVLAKLAEQKELLRGKEGAVMWAVSALDGKKLSEFKLDSLSVWDGMIASGGNLYMATMNGEVLCYSGKSN